MLGFIITRVGEGPYIQGLLSKQDFLIANKSLEGTYPFGLTTRTYPYSLPKHLTHCEGKTRDHL